MVGRWRANVILQRQMSKDSIFMHVWRLNLVWQERSINMEWRPRKNCFWNFVKVKSLTAGFILQLIKEQAQIVIRKVKVQTVLDQNLHSFYFTSYCWLWEIVTTEHLDPAAAAGEIRDGDGLAWCPWYGAMIPSACLLCIHEQARKRRQGSQFFYLETKLKNIYIMVDDTFEGFVMPRKPTAH